MRSAAFLFRFLGKLKRLAALALLLPCVFLSEGAALAASPVQSTYATPDEAVKDLVDAVRARDSRRLLAILGAGGRPLLSSGDPVADQAGGDDFIAAYDEAARVDQGGERAVLLTGKAEWPFPIPIVKADGKWRFDTMAGREEILNRRIGRNEIYTMQSALAYVDAQNEYYLRNPQRGTLLQYAQKFVSSPGKRDGLYYPTKPEEEASPLGPLFDDAKAQGYLKGPKGEPAAYHGYRYRILKAQGPNAKAGAYDYQVKSSLLGGFGLVAWPARYGNSGVMTFIVSHEGVLYEKDLGPDTAALAKKIVRFDPDSSWKKVSDPGK